MVKFPMPQRIQLFDVHPQHQTSPAGRLATSTMRKSAATTTTPVVMKVNTTAMTLRRNTASLQDLGTYDSISGSYKIMGMEFSPPDYINHGYG